MNTFSFIRRHRDIVACALSCLMIIGSIVLLRAHAEAVVAMRETGLPAAVRLPVIEERMNILAEQNEVAELQAALVSGSTDEQV